MLPPPALTLVLMIQVQVSKSSLMLVLARVPASTFLTITAQYNECVPSAAGKLPETTTEPAGTRP